MFSIGTTWCHLAGQQRGFRKRKFEEWIISEKCGARWDLLEGSLVSAQQDVSCLELGSLGGKWPRASPLPAGSVKPNFSLFQKGGSSASEPASARRSCRDEQSDCRRLRTKVGASRRASAGC